MTTVRSPHGVFGGEISSSPVEWPRLDLGSAYHQAYLVLRIGFTVLPILFGFDKFAHVMVSDWTYYLAPSIASALPVSAATFMLAVGVVEVVAGLIVAVKPSIGAYIVMLWLWAIVINLLMLGSSLDIALRDFGLSLGALALARLSGGLNLEGHSNALLGADARIGSGSA